MEGKTMNESENLGSDTNLTSAQEALRQLWEEHVRHEFATHNTEHTLATMVEDAYVNHIPTLTGGAGKAQLREFYSKRFIPQMPPDTDHLASSKIALDCHNPVGVDAVCWPVPR